MEEKVRTSTVAILIAIALLATASSGFGAAKDYQFELAGVPHNGGKGVSVVSVRLLHLPDKKPVSGAIIIESSADMGPIGMAAMTASVKSLPEQPAGTYRFEIQNGATWKKPNNWALTLAAKVQGEPETVHGSVVVKLQP
jgi:hypothetical protein